MRLALHREAAPISYQEFVSGDAFPYLGRHYRLKVEQASFAPLVDVKPVAVGIRCFKLRWGSCTVHGKLECNWQISMAPNRMVDYVVIHELCH